MLTWRQFLVNGLVNPILLVRNWLLVSWPHNSAVVRRCDVVLMMVMLLLLLRLLLLLLLVAQQRVGRAVTWWLKYVPHLQSDTVHSLVLGVLDVVTREIRDNRDIKDSPRRRAAWNGCCGRPARTTTARRRGRRRPPGRPTRRRRLRLAPPPGRRTARPSSSDNADFSAASFVSGI